MKILVATLLLLVSPGKERWAIKTLVDKADVHVAVFLPSTVEAQNEIDRPVGKWLSLPRQQDESYGIEVSGKIVEAGEEDDGDYHLVLQDDGARMICEVPDPDLCPGNKYDDAWRTVRALVDEQIGKPTRKVKHVDGPRVTVDGLGFWDKPDHGEGHSKNGREIHPVIKMRLIS